MTVVENEDIETVQSESEPIPVTEAPKQPEAEAVIQAPAVPQESPEVFSFSRSVINYLIVAAVFLGLGVVLGMNFGESGVDSRQVRVIVQEVFQEEMGTLQEAMASIAASTSVTSDGDINPEALAALVQAAVAEAMVEQVDYMEDDDPFLGPEDAPVVIVEFSDFLCSFCGRHYQQTLTPLLQNYEGYVRYVYRDFPGVGGQNAIESALAAECANEQGQFWEMHNVLFNNQPALSVSVDQLGGVLRGFAEDLQLDMEAYDQCYGERRYVADIISDSSDAQSIGARGTPGFYINGTFVSGAQPYEIFAALIEEELAKAGIDYQSS